MSERETTVFALWRRVNEIACSTENLTDIRNLIAEAGIDGGIHVGVKPGAFTPLMKAEWVLGQWRDMIEAESPWMNTCRNVSLAWYEDVTGTKPEWPWPKAVAR